MKNIFFVLCVLLVFVACQKPKNTKISCDDTVSNKDVQVINSSNEDVAIFDSLGDLRIILKRGEFYVDTLMQPFFIDGEEYDVVGISCVGRTVISISE